MLEKKGTLVSHGALRGTLGTAKSHNCVWRVFHVRMGMLSTSIQAGLVNEDELGRIKIKLTVEPGLTPHHQAWAFLLQCVCGLFCK